MGIKQTDIMKQFTQIVLLAITFIFTSCFEKEPKDKIEEVTMYVSHETGIYYGMLSSPVEGMLIKEEGWKDWESRPFQEISGFEYIKGHKYTLLVEKTTLANPPMDASNVKYKLISIVEQRSVAFPELAVKGLAQTEANGYEANIFDPVHFYLDGDEYMQENLRELCDSLVFDIMGSKDGTAKVYYQKTGEAKLTSSWVHRFYIPMSAMCRIQGYKNGEIVYTDSKQIKLHNNKDFLMYNWNEITQNSSSSIGYVNFLNPSLEIISTHYINQNTPVAKISIPDYPAEDQWLYEYMCQVYNSSPLYDENTGVAEKYSELFVGTDNRETVKYIWVTDKFVAALVNWFDSDVEISKSYIIAQPVQK